MSTDMRLETALAVADGDWGLAYQDEALATGSHQEILERALVVLATRVRVALGVFDPVEHGPRPEYQDNVIPFRHPGQREPGWR